MLMSFKDVGGKKYLLVPFNPSHTWVAQYDPSNT